MSLASSCIIRPKCTHVLQNKLYVTLLNYILIVPLYFLLISLIVKIHIEKTRNNIANRRKITSRHTPSLLHACNPCVSILMGSRAIMGLNCLCLFVLQRFIFCCAFGMANENISTTIPSTTYIILDNTALKILFIASTFIITAFMKNINELPKSFKEQFVFFPNLNLISQQYFSKCITNKKMANFLIVMLFVSWCVYPGFAPLNSSYSFKYWFDLSYFCMNGLLAFIFGLMLHNKVKLLLNDNTTSMKLIVLLIQCKYLIHIGFTTLVYIMFKIYYGVTMDNKAYKSADELSMLKLSFILIHDLFIGYIVYCCGRIFENKVQGSPFCICICVKKNVRAGIMHNLENSHLDLNHSSNNAARGNNDSCTIENKTGTLEIKTLYRV
jgi:hypothetical protein